MTCPPIRWLRFGLRRTGALFALAFLAGFTPAMAQEVVEDTLETARNPYGSGMGLEVVLTNSGFGLGGYWKRAVSPATSLLAEVMLAPGKDEREFKFTSFFRTSIPHKANYLVMLPVQVGLLHRLFRNQIEDNFRPYLQLSGGPTLGWVYPYFRDCNGNQILDEESGSEECRERSYDPIGALPRGHLQMGLGGNIALGAHFGTSRKMAQGVRVGYAFSYFFDDIQIMEPDIDGARQRFFGTPSISLTFGRLF